jgi:hypothetical protein
LSSSSSTKTWNKNVFYFFIFTGKAVWCDHWKRYQCEQIIPDWRV